MSRFTLILLVLATVALYVVVLAGAAMGQPRPDPWAGIPWADPFYTRPIPESDTQRRLRERNEQDWRNLNPPRVWVEPTPEWALPGYLMPPALPPRRQR